MKRKRSFRWLFKRLFAFLCAHSTFPSDSPYTLAASPKGLLNLLSYISTCVSLSVPRTFIHVFSRASLRRSSCVCDPLAFMHYPLTARHTFSSFDASSHTFPFCVTWSFPCSLLPPSLASTLHSPDCSSVFSVLLFLRYFVRSPSTPPCVPLFPDCK